MAEEDERIDYDSLVQKIIQGDYAMTGLVPGLIHSTMGLENVYSKIISASCNLERIQSIVPHFPMDKFQENLELIFEGLTKKNLTAGIFKSNGDEYSKNMGINMGIRCYNLAIMFTPRDNTKMLAELVGRRSVLFMAMNVKENALLDMDKAIDLDPTYPRILNYTTIKEQILEEAKQNKQHMPDELTRNLVKTYRETFLFNVPGETLPGLPEVSGSIYLGFDENKGRYLKVDKDIKPGTPIMVEDPYVTSLRYALRFEFRYCTNCFMRTQRLIPCDSCVLAAYCSTECMLDDYGKGHHLECKVIPYMTAIMSPRHLHLALKSICKAGPEKLYQLWKGSKVAQPGVIYEVLSGKEPTQEIGSIHYDKDGCSPNTYFLSSIADPYHRILNLTSHLNRSNVPCMTWMALSIAYVLDRTTNFFDVGLDEEEKKEFIEYVASIVLHHGFAFACNSRIITEVGEVADLKALCKRDRRLDKHIATGVYPISALINHSCTPNIHHVKLTNGRLVIFANRNILAGDALNDCYGNDHLSTPLDARRGDMFKKFSFLCKCDACIYDWPLLINLPLEIQFVCPTCCWDSNELSYTEIVRRILVIDDHQVGTCPICQVSIFMKPLLVTYCRQEKFLEEAKQMVVNGKTCQAIPRLLKCIEFFQKISCPPSLKHLLAQATLLEAYEVIISTPGSYS